MKKKQKIMLARIIVCAALLVIYHFLPVQGVVRFLLYFAAYILIGYDILRKAFLGIKNGRPLNGGLPFF